MIRNHHHVPGLELLEALTARLLGVATAAQRHNHQKSKETDPHSPSIAPAQHGSEVPRGIPEPADVHCLDVASALELYPPSPELEGGEVETSASYCVRAVVVLVALLLFLLLHPGLIAATAPDDARLLGLHAGGGRGHAGVLGQRAVQAEPPRSRPLRTATGDADEGRGRVVEGGASAAPP